MLEIARRLGTLVKQTKKTDKKSLSASALMYIPCIIRVSFRKMGKGGKIVLMKKMGGGGGGQRECTPSREWGSGGMLSHNFLSFTPSEITPGAFQTHLQFSNDMMGRPDFRVLI